MTFFQWYDATQGNEWNPFTFLLRFLTFFFFLLRRGLKAFVLPTRLPIPFLQFVKTSHTLLDTIVWAFFVSVHYCGAGALYMYLTNKTFPPFLTKKIIGSICPSLNSHYKSSLCLHLRIIKCWRNSSFKKIKIFPIRRGARLRKFTYLCTYPHHYRYLVLRKKKKV